MASIAPTAEAMHAPGGTLWGYPKGVLLLSFTELWERFSYFGMLAILVLYLTTAVADGGFGWSEPEALKLYGLYSGLAFTVPLIGGWIANSYWGERRCILVGGILIASGHAFMAGPKVVPAIASSFSGLDYHSLWVQANVPMGRLFVDSHTQQQLAGLGAAAGIDADSLALIYRLITFSFLGGLALIIFGTMLLKPTISSIVGQFFSRSDQRRDGAFALFLVGIYVGEIAGVFITGYLGERVAWHWGFGAAGFGMTLGLLVYTANEQRYLENLGKTPGGGGESLRALRNLNSVERDRLIVMFTQAFFTMLYSAALFQTGGLLTLFAREHVDRDRWGWEIPASWFTTLTSILFIVLTPVAARLWERLAARGRNPQTSVKLAWGLIAIGLAYALIAYVMFAVVQPTNAQVSPLWMLAMYVLFGLSEVAVWTGQLSLTSRLAPPNLSAIFVGGWYINIGLGTLLTGYLGALGYTWGMGEVFATVACGAMLAGAIVWLMTPRLTRLMHGIE
jgi:proton-dependent oligopeptide transporter, POT family